MTDRKNRLLLLHEAPGAGWNTLKKIYTIDPSFSLPFVLSPASLSNELSIPLKKASSLIHFLQKEKGKRTVQYYLDRNIIIITPFDSMYPRRLFQMHDPPWVLYVKGQTDILKKSSFLAVVGTRQPTSYGLQAMQMLLPPIIKKRAVIISGLAKGVDTRAHQLAVTHQGYTIAVCGSGFNYMYPRENLPLSRMISQSHLLVSEYPPHTPPAKWQFPMRNRIISALSDAVFVIEAGVKSGSLITASQALEQGRDVYALPGPIDSKVSAGTNKLIQDGARPILQPDDLL
ncbi:DNA-processing protein DprA [Bacillus sp. FJAT-44742]|uniref:DNA-processing protein DprA n=1 Tax=Bacillus sp. FJAT-44742 TaxID=2014005 RepID=UPI000C23FED6|nr:DNA-processing protein DprA [Bacillus sp. FJAT-44742]